MKVALAAIQEARARHSFVTYVASDGQRCHAHFVSCTSQVAHSSRALLALLNDAHAGARAAEQFATAAADALHQAGPAAPSLALCQILVSALELPITCMVGTVYSDASAPKVEARVPQMV